MADNGNSRAGGGGPLFGGVVLTLGDLVASELVCFKVYRSINACREWPI